MTNRRVDGQRLWDSLMEMAQIGATPKGGVKRLALSDEDRAGRDLFRRWCEDAGMTVSVDRLGNMFARRAGSDDSLAPIAMGSHLDSQPTGGKFDGAFGVLAGLEVVRALNDLGIQTQAPIEVINWTNEEGSRFAPAMMASGVFAGVFTTEEILAVTDPDGITVETELDRIGYVGDKPVGDHALGAYFEAHIEQGPILEAEEIPVGVVTGAQGTRWYDVRVTGMESHAGTTPMPLRKDAMMAAAHMVTALRAMILDYDPGVLTIGVMRCYPNSRNVIPGTVEFSIDLRHPDAAVIEQMDDKVGTLLAAVAAETGVSVEHETIWYSPPVPFDPECVSAVRDAAAALGYKHRDILSGAGHDAVYCARACPTAMIFVPCEDGISHNEVENAKPDELEAGTNVLLHAVLERAGVELDG